MSDRIRTDGATGLRMPVRGDCRLTRHRDPLGGSTTATWEFVPPDCDYVEIQRDILDHLLRTHDWEADQWATRPRPGEATREDQ